ncbi:Kelch-like ECH-associated protein [Echinococcus granulosus]|uniref:DNA-directed RNA polymerase n=3 Tax=Taeniidae TaxID=6208 RepID=W6UU47_ECHGR|nr:Kelch-like ECH-associated protein [Echinococcus granulosus]EUB64166.1 Kelch-like ECH-associated protein [Echinococcus granulosus]
MDVADGFIREFGYNFYTPHEIRSLSVLEVTSNATFDKVTNRGVDGGLHDMALGPCTEKDVCAHCGLGFLQCPGHIGHIEFSKPVYNPLLFDLVVRLLKSFCFSCFKIYDVDLLSACLELLGLPDLLLPSKPKPSEIEDLKSLTPAELRKTAMRSMATRRRIPCRNCTAKAWVLRHINHQQIVMRPVSDIRNSRHIGVSKYNVDADDANYEHGELESWAQVEAQLLGDKYTSHPVISFEDEVVVNAGVELNDLAESVRDRLKELSSGPQKEAFSSPVFSQLAVSIYDSYCLCDTVEQWSNLLRSTMKTSIMTKSTGEVEEDYPVSSLPASSTSSDTMDICGGQSVDAGCGSFVCFTPSDQGGGVRSTVYNLPEFFTDSMRVMYSLFQSGKLTDVTLHVEKVEIACHRIVLMGASPYFRAMFTSGMREEGVSEVRLHYLTPLALTRLVHFAYTGEICVSERNVCEILSAAIMLQISAVIGVCAQFLESQLHVSNALGLHEFATSVGCLELARKTQVFVDRNFSEIVKHDELLSLTPAQLMGLIQRDEIHVRSEAEVYNAVVRWVNHDKANRLVSLMDCLALVRCHALAPGFIRNQIKNCSLLAEVPQSRLHMQSVLSDLLQHKNIPVRWRADAHAQMIYSAGGYLRYSLSNFEAYNRATDTWRRLPDLPSPRSGLAAASVRGCVYLVGGRNNNNEQSKVDAPHMDCYDPTTNRWHTCAPMSVPRNRVAVGVVDDMIYAIGGLTHTMHHRTAEKSMIYSAGGYLRYSLSNFEAYNRVTDTWRRLPDVPSPRSDLAAASVRGCIYLVGGRNNNNEQSNVDAPHMDCYDPTTNRWHTCAPMSVPRNRMAVGVVDDMIYAIGGLTHNVPHRTAEKYDVDDDLWTPIAPMHYPRIGLGVAVVNRLLYAVGGFDGERRLSSVERYDPEADAWSEVAPLNRPRSGAASAAAAAAASSSSRIASWAGVVAIGHFIYAVGGYDSHSQLRSMERLNTEQNVWEYMTSMLHPRSALSASVLDGKIWVFGGYDGNEFLSSVEVYDPSRDTWTRTTVMPCGKSGHAVVTSREPVAAIAASATTSTSPSVVK